MLREAVTRINFNLPKFWKVDKCLRAVFLSKDGTVIFSKREENVGKRLSEIVQPKHKEIALEYFRRALEGIKSEFYVEDAHVIYIPLMDGVLAIAQKRKSRTVKQKDVI